jgi:putative transposase
MPRRIIPLATGEIYHVVNRGVNQQPIFHDRRDYKRALEILSYYRFVKPPVRFSFLNRLVPEEQGRIWKELEKKAQRLVTIFSFCLMPNHFHLLLRQEKENGISRFLANFQNSFTRYFNTRHKRSGHLLQGQFKAVRIENENQFLHTCRYIHLNPYTSFVIRTPQELKTYPWSSLKEYMGDDPCTICELDTILSSFPSKERYLRFILDQKDYQRALGQIKHLLLE